MTCMYGLTYIDLVVETIPYIMYCTRYEYPTMHNKNIILQKLIEIFVPIHSLPKDGGIITKSKSYIYMMMEILRQ